MEKIKEKLINLLETYLSIIIVVVMCVVFLTIDFIRFGINTDPKITIMLTIIYLFMSITISSLLRTQGIIVGKKNDLYIKADDDYNKTLNGIAQIERLDDWCSAKNDTIRLNAIKRQLRFAHLSFEIFENGGYEIPKNKNDKKEFLKKFSSRQIKAINYCQKIQSVEHYSANYLTSNLDKDQLRKGVKFISISGYLTKKTNSNIISGVLTSLVFAFLSVSLATDISFANFFFSLIKVVIWLAGGALSFLTAYVFVVQTYKDVLCDKTSKLKEFSNWVDNNPIDKE